MRVPFWLGLALVLIEPPLAAADARLDLHLGAGLESGLISGAPRPAGVAEAGVGLGWISADGNVGFGLVLDSVGRMTSSLDAAEEIKLDAVVLVTRPDRKFHAGVGVGMRSLTIAARDRRPTSQVSGLDLFRLGIARQLASWEVATARLGVEIAFTWTFGCYRGDVLGMPVGDMAAPSSRVRCVESITSTYVLGLQTAMTWR